MPKSQLVQNLDAIQTSVQSFLKPLGFCKKGRVHNRRTKHGLSHVISFQMGQFPIGENYVIPGLRKSFYGKLAINLGVFLPFVYEIERQRPPADMVQEYNCTIRQRLGVLAFGEDRWLEITDDIAGLATSIVNLLDQFGLNFFEQFKSYRDVIAYYDKHGDLPFQNSNRASLEVALIAFHIGDETLSKTLFDKARTSSHKGFQEHVTELEKRMKRTFPLTVQKN